METYFSGFPPKLEIKLNEEADQLVRLAVKQNTNPNVTRLNIAVSRAERTAIKLAREIDGKTNIKIFVLIEKRASLPVFLCFYL